MHCPYRVIFGNIFSIYCETIISKLDRYLYNTYPVGNILVHIFMMLSHYPGNHTNFLERGPHLSFQNMFVCMNHVSKLQNLGGRDLDFVSLGV